MLSVQDAEAKILQLVHPLHPEHDREWIPLDQACDRIPWRASISSLNVLITSPV